MPAKKSAVKDASDTPATLKTFQSHGVDVDRQVENGEIKTDCPFCDGSAFFVNVEEGTFHCKTCPMQGNKYVFLQLWFDRCYDKTTEAAKKKLAKDRGLPLDAIEFAEYAYDSCNKRWLVPVRNEKGAMVNLGRFSLTQLIDGKRPVLMTGGCKTHLGNLERLGDCDKVYVVEGPWDCIALEWLLYANKDKQSSVVWVPGSNNFNQEWSVHFNGKEVVLLYDNDDAGYLGMERVAEVLRNHGKPKSISQIKWPNSFPEKYDLRDYVGKKQKTPKKALGELLQMVEEVHFSKGREHSIERRTFAEVVEDYRQSIYLTKEMEDGLCIALSVIFSNRIFEDPYTPLWLYIVAPPGCLSHQTTVEFYRKGKGTRKQVMSIEELYRKFHGGESRGANGRKRTWNPKIDTYVRSRMHDGYIRLRKLNDVVYSGEQVVYRIEVDGGDNLDLTADHRVFTQDGWKTVQQVKVGADSIYCDVGVRKGRRADHSYQLVYGLKYHPHAYLRNEPAGPHYKKHRLVYEAHMNGVSYDDFVKQLRSNPNHNFQFLDRRQIVHHKNGDKQDNSIQNLELCQSISDHMLYHDQSNNRLSVTELKKVLSVKRVGKVPTYDLCVDDPHNFIVHGMTVHNSGKTLMLQTLAGSEEVRFETTMGPKTLVSGFKTSDNSDASLLPHLIGKTLIIEDFTGIMSLPAGEQEEIYGQLRSMYNGRYEKTFGHIGTRVYPDPNSEHKTCHFSILAGCTGVIHADARANQGERFLKYSMSSLINDNIAQVESAVKNTLEQTSPETLLREPVAAFIDYKLANPPEKLAKVPKWAEDRIIRLAQIVATVRAVVLRKSGELVVRPETEVATRISKQLIKLGQAVAFTLDKPTIDAEVYRIIQRVGMDTCYGWHRDALVAVAASQYPIRTEEISRDAVMARSTAFRCMEDLMELGAVTFQLSESGKRGKPAYLWSLTPQMQELWKRARIDTLALSRQVPMGKNAKKRLKANLPPSSSRKGTPTSNSNGTEIVGKIAS